MLVLTIATRMNTDILQGTHSHRIQIQIITNLFLRHVCRYYYFIQLNFGPLNIYVTTQSIYLTSSESKIK